MQREKPIPLAVAEEPNTIWSVDFTRDRLGAGNPLRLFNVADECNCVILGAEADFSLPATPVIRALDQIVG